MTSREEPVDILVIGAGPAGLTAAFTVVRQTYTAILFNSGNYCNGAAHHIHMILTWENRNPAKY
jgi:thioredoxin reductase